jgi:hypothetical protein
VHERPAEIEAAVEVLHGHVERPLRRRGIAWLKLDDLLAPLDADVHVVVPLGSVVRCATDPRHVEAFDAHVDRLGPPWQIHC